MALDLPTNIVIISIAFSIFAVAAVCFRFRARAIQRVKFGLDDYTIVAAVVSQHLVTGAAMT